MYGTRSTSTSRRRLLKQIAAAAASPIAAAPLVRGAAAQAIKPIRFGLQNTFSGASAVVWAREEIYKQRNLQVEPVKFTDGRGVRDAMLAGKVDIGTMNLTPYLVGAATGNFVLIGFILLGGDTVGLFGANGIERVQDLKGKNVSITVGSTTGGIFTDNAGPKFGLQKGDYRIVNLEPNLQVAALASGSISAFAGPEPYMIIAQQQKLGKVLLRFGEFDPNPTCLVVNASFLKENPDTVVAFLKSWLDGVKFWHEHPDKATESLLTMYREQGYADLTPSMIAQIVKLPKVEPDITPDLATYIKGQAEFLHKQNKLPVITNWDAVMRPDLLAKARAGA